MRHLPLVGIALIVAAVVAAVALAASQGHYEPLIGATIGIPLYAFISWAVARLVDGPNW